MNFRLFLILRRKISVKLVLVLNFLSMGLSEIQRVFIKLLLDFIQGSGYVLDKFVSINGRFISVAFIPSPHEYRIVGNISGADFHPNRNPFFDPVPAPGASDFPGVDLNLNPPMMIIGVSQFPGQGFGKRHYLGSVVRASENGYQHNMGRSDFWRQNNTVIITVGHDESADQSG